MKKSLAILFVIQMFALGLFAQDNAEPVHHSEHHRSMPSGMSGFNFGGSSTAVNIIPTDQMPHAENYLPDYARPEDPLFYNDSVQYEIGKTLRDTPRGELAIADASTSVNHYLSRFGEAMELPEMNSQDYPAMAALVNATFTSARNSIQSTKNYFKRERPYSHFKEPSSVPREERPNDLSSYPSGHAVRAWAIALALVGVDPAHQDQILKVGYELGQSRVIVGFHYQSDIDAARVAASAAFARICTEQTWVDLFNAAKAELEAKK